MSWCFLLIIIAQTIWHMMVYTSSLFREQEKADLIKDRLYVIVTMLAMFID